MTHKKKKKKKKKTFLNFKKNAAQLQRKKLIVDRVVGGRGGSEVGVCVVAVGNI